MSTTIQSAHSTDAAASGSREHVGYRYLRWTYYVEPGLNADQKAGGFEMFAAEFEALPASREPYEGWGETMAYLCRRIARRHRGEFVGEWVPQWERQRRARDRTFANLAESVHETGSAQFRHEAEDEPATANDPTLAGQSRVGGLGLRPAG